MNTLHLSMTRPREFLNFMSNWRPHETCRQRFFIFHQCIPMMEFKSEDYKEAGEKAGVLRNVLIRHQVLHTGKFSPHDPDVMRFVYKTIHPLFGVAASLEDKPRVVTPVVNGFVYLLESKHMDVIPLRVHLSRTEMVPECIFTLDFNLPGIRPSFRVTMSATTYAECMTAEKFLFFRHGAHVDDKVATELKLPPKFKQRIPRLAFGTNPCYFSDGIMLANCYGLGGTHGTDVTSFFSITTRTHTNRRRNRRRLRHQQRLADCFGRNPLLHLSLLDTHDLSKLAKTYLTLSHHEQLLFIYTFWTIGSDNMVRELPEFKEQAYLDFMDPMVHCMVDIHDPKNLTIHCMTRCTLWNRLRRIIPSTQWSPMISAVIELACYGHGSYNAPDDQQVHCIILYTYCVFAG